MPRRLRLIVVGLCLLFSAERVAAGAFMLPQGTGQLIAGVGYYEGSHRFDASGGVAPAPAYRKAEASGYLEYGVTPQFTLILAPAVAHADGSPGVTRLVGSDESAVGARLGLYEAPDRVVSLQVLVEPPLGDGGIATDARLLVGQSFAIGAWPAFVDAEAGVRFRNQPGPDEIKADVTIGIRPAPRVLVLLQDFNSLDTASTPLFARQSHSTLQASAVYDLAPRWSVQIGGFRVIAGRNAFLGTGPIAAVWYRF